MITLRDWLNVAKGLRFIDRDEFNRALPPAPGEFGTQEFNASNRYAAFEKDPIRWLARAPDADAEAVWKLVRQTNAPASLQDYEIEHIDGDLSNNEISNLWLKKRI